MAQSKKTDNQNLGAKLHLRRYFLDKYHQQIPASVMDCCQGNGVIWRVLRREYSLAQYWGMDLKAAPGRLLLDSARVLAQPGWTEDVIDVDTYGSPWEHWLSMLPHVNKPTTVFLTIGFVRMGGGGAMAGEAIKALGLGRLKCPPSLTARLHDLSVEYCIDVARQKGLRLAEIIESLPTRGNGFRNVRYLGVRLEPKGSGE